MTDFSCVSPCLMRYIFCVDRTVRIAVGVRTVALATMCLVLVAVPQAGRDPCVKSLALREPMALLAATSASARMVATVILLLAVVAVPLDGR